MQQEHDSSGSFGEIFRLAWPQTLMMLTHFFIGFADVLVAGMLDSAVQAALGLITQCLFFLLLIGQAVANGSVAAISQSMGACRFRRVGRYVGLSILLALALGVALLVGGYVVRTPFLTLLQVPDAIRDEARYFFNIYLLLMPAYYLLIITNAVFRAQKRVNIPMFSMFVVAGVNAFLDFGLGLGMFGLPQIGYRGLAWATFGSITAGALFNFVVLHRLNLLKRASFPPLRWIRAAMPYLLKVAGPSGAMQALWQSGYLVLFAIVAALPMAPVDALAGMTAGMRVEAILFLPAFAFSMTASILVGNSMGARNDAQAKRVALKVLGTGVALVSLTGLVLWRFVPELATLLSPEPAVQPHSISYLYYNICAIPFTAASMIMAGVMTGAGATIYTMVIYGGSTWFVRLPLAYLLGHVLWGNSEGVWMAMLLSQIVQATIMFIALLRGRWTRFAMRSKAHKPLTPPTAVVRS